MGRNKKISELTSIDTYDSTTYVPVSTGDGQVTRKLAVTSISPSGSGYTPYESGFGIDITNNILSVDTNDLNNTYSLTGHTHNQYLTEYTETDPIYESEKGNYSLTGHTHSTYSNKTIQVSGITISSNGWNSGTPWTYVLTNANITPDKFVDVIPSIESTDIVVNAEIYQQTLSGNGNVTLYSKNQPSGNIIITIRIFE